MGELVADDAMRKRGRLGEKEKREKDREEEEKEDEEEGEAEEEERGWGGKGGWKVVSSRRSFSYFCFMMHQLGESHPLSFENNENETLRQARQKTTMREREREREREIEREREREREREKEGEREKKDG